MKQLLSSNMLLLHLQAQQKKEKVKKEQELMLLASPSWFKNLLPITSSRIFSSSIHLCTSVWIKKTLVFSPVGFSFVQNKVYKNTCMKTHSWCQSLPAERISNWLPFQDKSKMVDNWTSRGLDSGGHGSQCFASWDFSLVHLVYLWFATLSLSVCVLTAFM